MNLPCARLDAHPAIRLQPVHHIFSVLPKAASLPEHSLSSCFQVIDKPVVGGPNHVTIEPVLIGATLVASRQKDGVAHGVKSKLDPLNAPAALTRRRAMC